MRALQRLLYRHRLGGLPGLPLLGLMRTGTNVTRTVLETHYEVRVDYNRFGWKHGLIPTLAPGCGWRYPELAPLVVVKHPLAVLHSLQRYAESVGRNLQVADATHLGRFIRGRVIYRCDELPTRPEYRFANPVQLWNSVVWNHLQFARQQGGLVVRYEDLLREPAATCERIARHFRLRARPECGTPVLPQQAVKRMKDEPGPRRQNYLSEEPFDKTAFFLEDGFVQHYDPADLAYVAQELDSELLQDLGYELPPQAVAAPVRAGAVTAQAN